MNPTDIVQYGALGVIVYVVVWFTIYGYPQAVKVIGSAITEAGKLALSKIDLVEERCAAERAQILAWFRAELASAREHSKEERVADQKARHEAINAFQTILLRTTSAAQNPPPRGGPTGDSPDTY